MRSTDAEAVEAIDRPKSGPHPTISSIRRIVTGHGPDGRSRFVQDGAATHVKTVATRPGFQSVNLWVTAGSPASMNEDDALDRLSGIAPPPQGTLLRIIDIPPESADPEETRKRIAATFSSMFTDAHQEQAGLQQHPGMHRTDTVDYIIVLSGELVAIMEDEETVMRAGDVLIQRGTKHAWANRSGAVARLAAVLIDAGP